MKRTQKVPQPKTRGIANVPVVMQMEMLECGAASLTMIMHYFHKWISLEEVRNDCGVSRDGTNSKNIMIAARSYGLIARAWRLEPEDLLEDGQFPCIIHWGFNHFVVLCGFKGKKAIINDPARGRVKVPWDEFDREFTGICMTFEPGEQFQPEGRPKNMFVYVAERIRSAKAAVVFAVLVSIITSLFGFISPSFNRIFLDRLLTKNSPDWIIPFMLIFSGFILLNIFTACIARLYSLRLEGQMAAEGNISYLWHVLRLPMLFFSQRMPGDITDRQATNASIANALVNTFAPLFLNTVMMIFYLIIMFRYSWILALVGVGSVALNLIASACVSAKRVNILRVQQRDQAKLSSTTMSGIHMIETIKASGAENGFFGKWSDMQASVNMQTVSFLHTNQWLSMIVSIFSSLANVAIMGLGVLFVIRGKFTVGMIMAFQGFLSSFMDPASELINAGQTLHQMTTQMERVDDVMNYPRESCFSERPKTGEYAKLRGLIDVKNVTFGYSPLGKPQIEDLSLHIEPGQSIALVGFSGCGKSTIAKLLSGLYQPWSGEILFDGKPLSEIDRNVFTGSVAVIDQDITLFDDTISDNIKMWDESIEDYEVIMAACDADIHNDIMRMPDGYRHKLLEGGQDLSGGQRQRIEIARALAQDPAICILDEATSALDAKTEYEITTAIHDRGITTIVIAHRLSTIRDCDEIIVLDHGRIVERGRHDELIVRDGLYARLVTSE